LLDYTRKDLVQCTSGAVHFWCSALLEQKVETALDWGYISWLGLQPQDTTSNTCQL